MDRTVPRRSGFPGTGLGQHRIGGVLCWLMQLPAGCLHRIHKVVINEQLCAANENGTGNRDIVNILEQPRRRFATIANEPFLVVLTVILPRCDAQRQESKEPTQSNKESSHVAPVAMIDYVRFVHRFAIALSSQSDQRRSP